ncbi:hypothetical protein BDR03DRAFT_502908 [Suillus americanus]|nr:hypothetical protein BDR03DRAFT_502908 [Suillus americanus]
MEGLQAYPALSAFLITWGVGGVIAPHLSISPIVGFGRCPRFSGHSSSWPTVTAKSIQVYTTDLPPISSDSVTTAASVVFCRDSMCLSLSHLRLI